MTSRQATNAIILSGRTGDRPVHSHERNLPENSAFIKGRVDGKVSFYVVYSATGYYEGTPRPAGVTPSKIVDSQTDVIFGFRARSTQGWDKVGITLFQHPNYCGTGVTYSRTEADITSLFPSGQSQGACSFIIMKGVWTLYTGKNTGGTQVKINGQVEFGPGCRIEQLERAGDLIQSIKCLRDS